MEGEDEEQISPNSFGNKSILQRFSTIVAGPIFNIILANNTFSSSIFVYRFSND